MKALLPALVVALVGLLPVPATANPYADAVQTRILQGWRLDDGSLMAGLEITLAPGWKTYWREPGDAGIPPVFDWTGSRNLRNIDIAWPAPDVFTQSGSRSIGYRERVVLPLTVGPRRDGRPVRLNGTVDIGICSEVCVPVRIELNEVLNGTVTRPDPVIAAALAELPFSATEAGLKASKCTLAPTSDGLALRAEFTLPATGGREMAVVETGDPLIWASEPAITRSGSRLVAEFELMHANGGAFAIDRSALRFTILGSQYAVDVRGCGG